LIPDESKRESKHGSFFMRNEKRFRPEIGCYYFPNYHPGDRRNTAYHGPGWSEWELVKKAIPRFPGHCQPKVPIWGYSDESDPEVMEQKIAAAADAGIDYFIYDYYYYNDGTFLEDALDRGLLRAGNLDRIKFCLMWANHDWTDIHPCNRKNRALMYPALVSEETFDRLCEEVIEKYFLNPSYYCIGGKPYFSIYHVANFIKSSGGPEPAKVWLERFRQKARSAGLPGLHLNAVVCGRPILPGECPSDLDVTVPQLGFDSITSYVWVHHVDLGTGNEFPYLDAMNGYLRYWDQIRERSRLPYYPNLTVGWDSSPRTIPSEIWSPDASYPYGPVIGGNTPENFEKALICFKKRMRENHTPTFNINCWNEWTEGSMLEPEGEYGYGYLDVIRDVFGTRTGLGGRMVSEE